MICLPVEIIIFYVSKIMGEGGFDSGVIAGKIRGFGRNLASRLRRGPSVKQPLATVVEAPVEAASSPPQVLPKPDTSITEKSQIPEQRAEVKEGEGNRWREGRSAWDSQLIARVDSVIAAAQAIYDAEMAKLGNDTGKLSAEMKMLGDALLLNKWIDKSPDSVDYNPQTGLFTNSDGKVEDIAVYQARIVAAVRKVRDSQDGPEDVRQQARKALEGGMDDRLINTKNREGVDIVVLDREVYETGEIVREANKILIALGRDFAPRSDKLTPKQQEIVMSIGKVLMATNAYNYPNSPLAREGSLPVPVQLELLHEIFSQIKADGEMAGVAGLTSRTIFRRLNISYVEQSGIGKLNDWMVERLDILPVKVEGEEWQANLAQMSALEILHNLELVRFMTQDAQEGFNAFFKKIGVPVEWASLPSVDKRFLPLARALIAKENAVVFNNITREAVGDAHDYEQIVSNLSGKKLEKVKSMLKRNQLTWSVVQDKAMFTAVWFMPLFGIITSSMDDDSSGPAYSSGSPSLY